MADFDIAFAALMKNEGVTLLDDPRTGEYSRYGLTAKTAMALLLCTAAGAREYIDALTLFTAHEVYRAHWWLPMHLYGLGDQAVATKLLDMGVNMGIPQAIKLLQEALNTLHLTVTVDGRMGPNTLVALVNADAPMLLIELRANATAFYHSLVNENPEKYAKYWDTWKARAAQ